MAPSSPRDDAEETTALLAAARGGDRGAYDQVFEKLYEELRRVASRQAARLGAAPTLSTTALVNEVYLKLGGDRLVAGEDRAHFFAVAAKAMRQILVDHARHKGRAKRGGGAPLVALDLGGEELAAAAPEMSVEDLLTLDRALSKLSELDPELERLVEWRYFAGLSLEEIAVLTERTTRTVHRHWQLARGFLHGELAGAAEGSA